MWSYIFSIFFILILYQFFKVLSRTTMPKNYKHVIQLDKFKIVRKIDPNKNLYKTNKIPEFLDVIVIGSGIGGLSTAALLSKCGRKVLVLEQHNIAGGSTHSFEDHGFEFDTGIHYVGNMSKEKTHFGFNMQKVSNGTKWEVKPMVCMMKYIWKVNILNLEQGNKISSMI